MIKSSLLKEVPPFLGGFCLVTDRKLCGLTCEEMTRIALEAGAGWIQYREKEKTRREIYGEAIRLRELTTEYGAALVVNDHTDIARAVGADGVHLGQDDLPLKEARRIMGDRIVGISTHSLPEAMDAERNGADYIGFGPVFVTTTKDAGEPRGLEMLGRIRKAVKIPVVAIGGISEESLPLVLNAGADAVAVASAVLRGDISENVRSFMRIIRDE
ncbi:MAG TPA: thiamine phosphate synthase [Thermodesulfovibrionales bacterium]|nr:thiamine phosphate synthase [Thermodesulfovibrionales bacterium]